MVKVVKQVSSPTFFKNQNDFRKWLEINHKKERGRFNMSWSQSVDQALCFGWIDGVRRSLGEESYCIRFTPRRPGSTWSNVNIKKVEELIEQGLMQSNGLEIYKQRKEEKSRVASYESEAKQFDHDMLTTFKENLTGWEFFTKQAPSYQKTMIHWILSAKQDTTKSNRLERLIAASEEQKRLFQ